MKADAHTEVKARATAEVDDVSARVVHALEENARLARATMLAIDRYVETMIRFLTTGPGGAVEARRRATALGLNRLEDYLAQRMDEAGQLRMPSSRQSEIWEQKP
jgi:hypothetical protein